MAFILSRVQKNRGCVLSRHMHRFPEPVFNYSNAASARLNDSEARARASEMLTQAIHATPPGTIRRARIIFLYTCDSVQENIQSIVGAEWCYVDDVVFPAAISEIFSREGVYVAGIHIQLDVPEDDEWPKLVDKMPIARAQLPDPPATLDDPATD